MEKREKERRKGEKEGGEGGREETGGRERVL